MKNIKIIFIGLLIIISSIFCSCNFKSKNNQKIDYSMDEFYSMQWALKNDGILQTNLKLLNDTKFIKIASLSETINNIHTTKNIDIHYEEAMEEFQNSVIKNNVLIAIIDTGIDIEHFELKDSIYINKSEISNNNIDDDKNGFIDDYNGWNFVDNNNIVYKNEIEDSHATHIAGIISAKTNNGGIRGIAYNEHIKILPIKILDNKMEGDTDNLVKAIDYALKFKADVINISLGTKAYNRNLDEIIREHSDTIFVIAAGNTTVGANIDETNIYPASLNYQNVITVGNLDINGKKFPTSNYAKWNVTIFAPGTFVLSTLPNNDFGFWTGSSVACPVISASIALMKCINKNLTSMQIKNILKNTVNVTDDLKNLCASNGYLNLYEALKKCKEFK